MALRCTSIKQCKLNFSDLSILFCTSTLIVHRIPYKELAKIQGMKKNERQNIVEFIFFKANSTNLAETNIYVIFCSDIFAHNFDKLTVHLWPHSKFICWLCENVHETFPIWEISFDETDLMTLTSVLFLCFQFSTITYLIPELPIFTNWAQWTQQSVVFFFPFWYVWNICPFRWK